MPLAERRLAAPRGILTVDTAAPPKAGSSRTARFVRTALLVAALALGVVVALAFAAGGLGMLIFVIFG